MYGAKIVFGNYARKALMGRQTKKGIDYCPLDVTFDFDPKIKLLTQTFGSFGRDFYISCLLTGYRENGYYYQPTEYDFEMFVEERSGILGRITKYDVFDILYFCLQKSLFCQQKFDLCGVLTSLRMQESYFRVAKRRDEINITKELLMVQFTEEELVKDKLNERLVLVNINTISVDENLIYVYKNYITQKYSLTEIPFMQTVKIPPTTPLIRELKISKISESEGTHAHAHAHDILSLSIFQKENLINLLNKNSSISPDKIESVVEKYILNRRQNQLYFKTKYFCNTKGMEISTQEELEIDLQKFSLYENNFSNHVPQNREKMSVADRARGYDELAKQSIR